MINLFDASAKEEPHLLGSKVIFALQCNFMAALHRNNPLLAHELITGDLLIMRPVSTLRRPQSRPPIPLKSEATLITSDAILIVRRPSTGLLPGECLQGKR